MIEKIESGDEVLALIVRANYGSEGVAFVTPEDNPLQLGILIHRSGAKIRPHVHKESSRVVNEVQEVLHVEYGAVEAEIYESSGRIVANVVLNSGDTILLLSGGHGFNILEDSRIIEVKQGPYVNVKEDKSYLEVEG